MNDQEKMFFERQKELEEKHKELRRELARVKLSALESSEDQARLQKRQEELRVELFNIKYQIATLKLVTKRSKE